MIGLLGVVVLFVLIVLLALGTGQLMDWLTKECWGSHCFHDEPLKVWVKDANCQRRDVRIAEKRSCCKCSYSYHKTFSSADYDAKWIEVPGPSVSE